MNAKQCVREGEREKGGKETEATLVRDEVLRTGKRFGETLSAEATSFRF